MVKINIILKLLNFIIIYGEVELFFYCFNILMDEYGILKIKEGCKYIDEIDCCFICIIWFWLFNVGLYYIFFFFEMFVI